VDARKRRVRLNGLQGVNVAAITPRGKQGDVDFGATFELIDHLCSAGVNGIALFTPWGEFPAVSVEERARLTYLAAKRSRVPVLVGVGAGSLEQSVALAREAAVAGAAALLVPPPYFFHYQQEEIKEFYLQFARRIGSGPAVFLSNAPSVTSEISVETTLALLETGKFEGIEDASGKPGLLDCFQGRIGSPAFVAGHDALFSPARAAGMPVISAAASAAPELVVSLDRAIADDNGEAISRLDGLLREFVTWMEQFPQPVAIKAAAGLRGWKTGPLLVPLSAGKQKKLEEFREWFQSWLPSTRKLTAHA